MSRTIDERVVEMEFDNKQFESGVQTSLKTLNNLKKGLDLDASTKSLQELGKAGKRFDMSHLADGVENVAARFSRLGIVGMTALQNLTNSAVNAGKRIASALTIDPIKMGFSEYETQINAVQTILANTKSKGTTLTDVNRALDELNTYADKTIYNFTEMTRNIGTFTAAGVGLETSVTAIKGIANLAAVSGANSQKASVAMYQLSQALASGTVKLTDWNSVVNAGMGGEVFQNALKETARANGIAIDDIIAANGSFRESLQKGWLSTDILTQTLEKFTMATEGMTEAEIEANRVKLKSIGYTDEQIEEIFELGNTATNAATKVKTLTQLFDTLKEAAQSGWTQTWELIVGDFDEARDLFTKISDTVGKMIGDSADARNQLLTGGLSSGWKQLLGKGIADEEGLKEAIKAVAKERSIEVEKWEKEDGSFEKTLKRGWLSADILAQSLVNLRNKTKDMSDEQLNAIGYTRDQVNALDRLCALIVKGDVSIEDLSKDLAKISGRENIISALENSFNGILEVLQPIKEAWAEVFPKVTAEQIYQFTERMKELTARFTISEETAEKLKTTFKGLFSAVRMGVELVKALFASLKKLTQYFGPVKDKLLGMTESLGLWLVELEESVRTGDIFTQAFEKIEGVITTVAGWVSVGVEKIRAALQKLGEIDFGKLFAWTDKLREGFKPFEWLGVAFQKTVTAMQKVIAWVSPYFDTLKEKLGTLFRNADFGGMMDLLNGGLFAAILLGIKKFVSSLTSITDNAGGFLEKVTGILDGVRSALKAYTADIKAKLILKIAAAIAILAVSLALLAMIDPAKLAGALAAVGGLFAELLVSLSQFTKIATGTKFKGVATLVAALLALAASVFLLSTAVLILATLEWEELVRGLAGVAGLCVALVVTSKALGKASGGMIKGSANLIVMAAAIGILAGVVKSLAKLDPAAMMQGLLGVGAICLELSLFLKQTDMDGGGFKKGMGLIALALAVRILAGAVKAFGKLSPEEMLLGLSALTVVLTELAVFTRVTGNNKNVISTAVAMGILGVAMLIFADVIEKMGNLDIAVIGKGLLGLAGALVILVVALKFMPKNLVGMGLGLVIIASALLIITKAVGDMGKMPWGEIGRGLVLLAGSMAILVVASLLMKQAIPGALAILVVAGALAILSPVLRAFGAMPLAEIGKSLLMLAGIFVVLGLAGLVLAPLVPAILGLAAAVALLGVGALALGAGLLLFSAGLAALAVSGTAGAAALVAIVTSLMDLIPLMAVKLGEGILAFAQVLSTGMPVLTEALITAIRALLQAILTLAPEITNTIFQLIISLLTVIGDNMGQFVQAGVDLLLAFLGGIASNIGAVIATVVELITAFIGGIAEQIPNIIQSAFDLMISFINGLAEAIEVNTPILVEAVVNLAGSIIDGLVDGLFAGVKAVGDSIVKVGKTALDGLKDLLGINSPSKEFEIVGKYSDMGLAKGLKEYSSLAEKAAVGVGESAIRPVVDMTDGALSDSRRLNKSLRQMTSGVTKIEPMVYSESNVTVNHTFDKLVVEGVNSKGEFVAAADYAVEELLASLMRRQIRI